MKMYLVGKTFAAKMNQCCCHLSKTMNTELKTSLLNKRYFSEGQNNEGEEIATNNLVKIGPRDSRLHRCWGERRRNRRYGASPLENAANNLTLFQHGDACWHLFAAHCSIPAGGYLRHSNIRFYAAGGLFFSTEQQNSSWLMTAAILTNFCVFAFFKI